MKSGSKSSLRPESDCLDSLDRQNRRRHGEQCVEAGSPGGGAQDPNVRHELVHFPAARVSCRVS